MNKFPLLLLAGTLTLLSSGCQGPRDKVQGKILFDIGYGKSDSSLDVSSPTENSVSISMNKGIIHILSRNEAKILRMSSYGQTLAMWYDPSRGSAPIVLKSVQMNEVASSRELGRFAIQVPFGAPSLMVADSRQALYVADEGIIRRFDSNGMELQFIGQEGLGGTKFAGISALSVLENDDLAVLCASASGNEIYFYDRDGTFLHVLKLNDENVPVPVPLADKYPVGKGTRIVASMESAQPSMLAGKQAVMMKINYYLEKSDPSSSVTLSIDPISSWIIAVDAATGAIIDSFALQSSVSDTGIDQQMVSVKSGGIVCIRWSDIGLGGEVLQYNQKGKITGKLNFMAPDAGAELMALTVGADGYLYILGQLPTTLRMYAWRLPA